jgi:hypothetical protein
MNINMPKNMNTLKSAAALSLVLFLNACGGGGETESNQPPLGSSSSITPVTAPPPTTNGRTITGLASKSPISGASVSLYAIDDFGLPAGSPVATGQTDDNGEFSLTVQAEIDLLLMTSGGVFIDESDQETDIALKRKITLGLGEGFMSLIPADGTAAAVTPFTDLLIRRSQNEAANSGGFMSKLGVVKNLVDAELGFDVLNTIPANPINPAAGATAAQMQYALFLGAFANAVNNISLQLGEAAPTFNIIQAVAEDLGDGGLDGAYFGDQVIVFFDNGDGGESTAALPTNVDFAQELARFRNNNFTSFSTTTLPVPTGSSISNVAPTADAGVDQTVNVGSTVMLSAAGSVDPDGAPLTFSWAEISGTDVVLTGGSTATPSFIADASLFGRGNIAFRLTVTDNVGFTSTDMVEVNIVDAAPTANAGVDQTVNAGDTVTLTAAGSVDPEGGPLTFSWVEISGADTVLTGGATATPLFVADASLFGSASVTFELTVTDNVGLTSTDSVVINVAATIASSIFLMAESGQFIEDGIPIDGGVKLDFNSNGTGLLIDSSPVPFDWSETTDGTILLDFSGIGGLIEDDYTDFGNDFGFGTGFNFGGVFDLFGLSSGNDVFPEGIEITEITNTIEIEVLTEGVNSDQVLITISGVRERFDVTNNVSLSDEVRSETEVLTAYDASIHTAFVAPLGTRILPTTARTGTPTLFDNELYDDSLSFETDGTGFALYKDHAFTWTIESDGHLNVVFANGEVADYFKFNTLADGDAIGVLFTDLNGGVISDGFLSVTQEVVSLSVSDIAGIFTTQQNFDLDDGTIVDQDRKLRLYPNGTAQLETTAIDPSTGARVPAFLPFGRCWGVIGNQVVLTTAFDGSGINTAGEDCFGALDDFTAFSRSTFNVLQVEGSRFRSHLVQEDSICTSGSTSSCTSTNVTDIHLIISDRVPLTSTPAYALVDFANVLDLVNTIDITVLDNDVLGDAAIDTASVVIDTQPQFGTVAVNSSTGVITYTPGVAFTGEDAFFYRVSDANGLQSSYAPVIISFDPIAEAGIDIMARSGDLVTLNGSDSSASGSVINYTWTQINGPSVSLDDVNIARPSFSALGLPISGASYEFELQIEDENGNLSSDFVIVDLPPSIPMTFFGAVEFDVPVQFGIDVDTFGIIVSLLSDGSGFVNRSEGSFLLSWTESAGSLVLDFTSFSATGGIPTGSFTTFEDVDGLPGDEELMVSTFDTGLQLFFNVDGDGKDLVDVIATTSETRFDLTNSVALASQTFTPDVAAAIYDTAAGIPYVNLGGVTLSLPTDVSVQIPTINSAPQLQTDELTFVSDGTGTARHKNETFFWSLGSDGHLEVEFAGGDIASYFNVESKPSGDFVAVLYQYNSGDVRAFADLSFRKGGVSGFSAGSIAGAYSSIAQMTLDDGSVVPQISNYIVNADGTGILELENIDPVTGLADAWFNSSFGICATVNGGNEMVWYRVRDRDTRFPGSLQPAVSTCSALTMADVSFMRTHSLFEQRTGGEIALVVVNGENDCGLPPTPAAGCDENVINTTAIFPTIFSYTSYDGQAPITVADNGSFDNGFAQTYNVLANDIIGDTGLDLTSVEIVVQPKDGVATVDPISGMITVTMDTIETNVSLYYRVTDLNGNVSPISPLNLSANVGT